MGRSINRGTGSHKPYKHRGCFFAVIPEGKRDFGRKKSGRRKRKKALDDGSVKGLIISRDYTNVGEGVAIQNIVDGVSTWTIAVEVVAVVQ